MVGKSLPELCEWRLLTVFVVDASGCCMERACLGELMSVWCGWGGEMCSADLARNIGIVRTAGSVIPFEDER